MTYGTVGMLAYSSQRESLSFQKKTGNPGCQLGPLPEAFQSPRHAALLHQNLGMESSHPEATRLGKLSNALWVGSATLSFLHPKTDPSKNCPVLQPMNSTSSYSFNQWGKGEASIS